jgi:hypothetical protein
MSVEDTETVDFISTKKESETVVLTISDHLGWGNQEHLETLQDKLNAYLRFIESGEIYDSYPSSKGKKIQICVSLKYEPDDEGEKFLEKCTDIILSSGYQFIYEVL